ncbi:nicotinate-nucleotide--dimethylbenzimidazole phosphoribosyltransferase [Paraflavitalea sp. CAU 1676]|uniref:nicotinate-nucleotide--dimethylbenzimidazole phosphoribosyltransferase n=1 Tax=Paraflavitalea sp. CAU 1676 TaxID=3032598 RepID=UPI0023DC54BA|nr:nicotinate-nucleotide--dimethylbenzimidazole phosphoribosyltransferase [Paraflavitalea sp. CAU 1676]MDF2187189.1 nicotinate-nucleotide--dimethylbenzimidazole phosphoribosyltransferase [Paraflavitalea sp. CAU 1676]
MTTNSTITSLQADLQHKIDNKTKPPGSLGVLEQLALQVGLIQETVSPVITQPHIVVFAGDHGIALTGLVNPYPQAVTAQMVLNFLNGGAAINVFCRQHNIALQVVDAGVNADLIPASSQLKVKGGEVFINAKIDMGTTNYLEGPAMTKEAARAAIDEGRAIVNSLADRGCNCIGFGEMGIGNTSSASLIMSAVTGMPVAACVGRGTGVNNSQLETKVQTLEKVHALHMLSALADQPMALLATVGGYEIAMMAGAYIEAAAQKMVIVVDGFITTAALLIAQQLDPRVLQYCVFAHTSGEHGHARMLEHLKATPLLQLGLRLGEGTGAALAIPLIQSAVNFLAEMASFESAGVSNKE